LNEDFYLLKKKFSSILRLLNIFLWPVFLLLALCANEIVLLLLTEKWIDIVPVIQFLAIARFVTILGGVNVNLIYSIGRSDLILKQQVLKILIRVLLLLISLPFGIYYIALSEFIATIIHYFINTYYSGKFLGFNGLDQLLKSKYIFMCSLIFIFVKISANYILNDYLLILFVTLFFGIFFYYVLLRICNTNEIKINNFKKIRI